MSALSDAMTGDGRDQSLFEAISDIVGLPVKKPLLPAARPFHDDDLAAAGDDLRDQADADWRTDWKDLA